VKDWGVIPSVGGIESLAQSTRQSPLSLAVNFDGNAWDEALEQVAKATQSILDRFLIEDGESKPHMQQTFIHRRI
jgi:hypothetical protein